jgi:ribose transport system permease protein
MSLITRAISPRRASALYALAGLIVLFGALDPDQFLTTTTLRVVANGTAITAIVAVTLVIPLAAGVFDVSVGYVVALNGTLVAYLVAKTSMGPEAAIALTLIAGMLLSAINILVVVVLRVPSLIGTLATGLVFLALTTALSSQQTITKNVASISDLLDVDLLGMTLPVWILIVLTIAVGVTMRATPIGRYWYAIGFDREAALLAGLPVKRLQAAALVTSGLCASIAGILLTARIGSGNPTSGPDYLLPAFGAAFFGATQFGGSRFNALGTVIAAYVLATATTGLNLLGAPLWTPQLLQGLVLIAAVAINVAEPRRREGAPRRWSLRRAPRLLTTAPAAAGEHDDRETTG